MSTVAVAYGEPASADHNKDEHSENMELLFNSPAGGPFSPNRTQRINSDLAFWGDRAYAGNYYGFRTFDVSDPASPQLLSRFECFGPQNDTVVWENDLLFVAIDRTLKSPECLPERQNITPSDDPAGWEGVRIFDVSNPRNPELIGNVYTDCGAHTITLQPLPSDPGRILLYASSYPLAPGPTCGAANFDNTENPFDGDPGSPGDPLHGVIQVIEVPLDDPASAQEIAQPEITYPGDPDNQFIWAEHGLGFEGGNLPGLEDAARACHDIQVFVELNLAAGACAEQGQLWNVDPATGLPDTENPVWVFDDVADTNGATGDPNDDEVVIDFFHTAAFNWDGSVVNFVDESFGEGCPPTTPAPGLEAQDPDDRSQPNPAYPGDTGRMFFVDTATGQKLSHFMIPRSEADDKVQYCSAHIQGFVPTADGSDWMVAAWYRGGVDVIDVNDPTNPTEVAFYDRQDGDNWSAYWYEGPSLPGDTLTLYASDGVHIPRDGKGFQVYSVEGLGIPEVNLDRLNPQTQEAVISP